MMIKLQLKFNNYTIFGILCFILCCQNGFAQKLIPRITNYTKADYSGYLQNWAIDQTEEGLIVVGNMAGLMIYNGEKWSLHPLPNQSVVRSVKAIGDRVYVGSYEEFGYFKQTESGAYQYTSVSDLLSEKDFRNEGFWNIKAVNDNVYFQSFTSIYEYNATSNATENLHPNFTPSKIEVLHGSLFAFAVNANAFQYENNDFSIIELPESLKSQSIHVTELPNNSALLCSQNFQCYTFSNEKFEYFPLPNNSFFTQNQLNAVKSLTNGDIIFGSIQKGMFQLSAEEENYTLNYGNGLRNNTILDIGIDQEQNIWLALDDGISYIQNQSPNRYYTDQTGQLGAVFTAIEFDNTIYLGSNKGLFYFKNGELTSVQGIANQVWFLKVVNGKLICGHNQGTSSVRNGNSTLISDITGGWKMKKIPNTENKYLLSTYTEMALITIANNEITTKRIDGFVAPIKYFEWINDEQILAIHANKGIYKLSFSPEFDRVITIQNIAVKEFENIHPIQMTAVNGSIILFANQWYRYDKVSQQITKDSTISALFPKSKGMIQGNLSGELWSIENDLIQQFESRKNEVNEFSVRDFDNLRVRDDEFLFRNSSGNYLLTINNGYIYLQQQVKTSNIKKPIITALNSAIGLQEKTPFAQKFAHNVKGLTIQFATPEFQDAVNYQYRLQKGAKWQTTAASSLVFEKIGAGDYQFEVKSIYPDGRTSESSNYEFSVGNHPLKSLPAYILYAVILFSIYWLYQRNQKVKLRKKEIEFKKELHREHLHNVKEEKLRLEKRMAEIKNQQLQQNIDVKKKELANSTLSLVKKNELLADIKKEIKQAESDSENKHLKQLVRSIDKSLSQKQNWELFETQFNEVHKEFLSELKNEYPDLTKKDLKLCAYLKTNLTSKEIAPLMNISVRGVETHRYRLRKKLDIDTNDNFQEFLEEFTIYTAFLLLHQYFI